MRGGMQQRCSATGKIAHRSKAKAREVVRQIRRRDLDASLYFCERCQMWHVTSIPREEYRRHVRGIGPAVRP